MKIEIAWHDIDDVLTEPLRIRVPHAEYVGCRETFVLNEHSRELHRVLFLRTNRVMRFSMEECNIDQIKMATDLTREQALTMPHADPCGHCLPEGLIASP